MGIDGGVMVARSAQFGSPTYSQIHGSPIGGMLSDIRQPQPVRTSEREPPLDQISRNVANAPTVATIGALAAGDG